MIKYVLICKNEHKFESWFSDSKEYEKLEKKHLLQCIHCNSKEIKQSIITKKVIKKYMALFHLRNVKNLKRKASNFRLFLGLMIKVT